MKWSAATPSVLSPRSLSLNLNFSMLVLILSDGVAVKRSLDAGACKLFTATSRQQFSQANKASEGCAGCEVRAAWHRNRYRLMLQLQPSIDGSDSTIVQGAKRTSSLALCVHRWKIKAASAINLKDTQIQYLVAGSVQCAACSVACLKVSSALAQMCVKWRHRNLL